MIRPDPLAAAQLCRLCEHERLGFETTNDLEDVQAPIGQARALNALQFAVRMARDGYNVFALGTPGSGKATTFNDELRREAANRPAPPDWCYVHNFDDPARPRALQLDSGLGNRFRIDMDRLIEDLATALPAAFQTEEYQGRIEEIEEELRERQSSAINELRDTARSQQVALLHTPAGFAFAPISDDDETLRSEQFAALPADQQKAIQDKIEKLQEQLQKTLRQFPVWQKEARDRVRSLNREVAQFATRHMFDALRERYSGMDNVLGYLSLVQDDIVERIEELRGAGENQPSSPFMPAPAPGAVFHRYRINVLVSHDANKTAPVVTEEMPTHANLIGRTEHQAQMGTLVTDFTLIRPGALHRANGGYLIVDAKRVLLQPFAWESLKRALRAREIRIESPERTLGLISTVSLEPEPVPLDVKVILVGDRMLYYLLAEHDDEFADLFKVAADFDDDIPRGDGNDLEFARLVATLVRRHDLRALDRGAVARVMEYAARLAGDAERLSTHLRSLVDLLREADHWADMAGETLIQRVHVQRAVDERVHRSDRVRNRMYDEIQRGTMMLDTQGSATGQINALTVLQLGDFAFGRPTRITAVTRLGDGAVLDIERETELGGRLHTKGVLILTRFLASRYARTMPLSMSASLVFEQSYGMVDGDSASLAELLVLLSSLSGLGLRQDLAVTGSINQLGQVQAIGGVNEKIEGFFDVCKAAGLNGQQGVVIPHTNIRHLMLREDIVSAARDSQFHIWAVHTVDEAVELFMTTPAGEIDETGEFPPGSVNARVNARLEEWATMRRDFGRPPRDESEHDKRR